MGFGGRFQIVEWPGAIAGAPSPLRTGLEGFPFIRLERPKNAPMNNEDAA
jgi:hypothetical protein